MADISEQLVFLADIIKEIDEIVIGLGHYRDWHDDNSTMTMHDMAQNLRTLAQFAAPEFQERAKLYAGGIDVDDTNISAMDYNFDEVIDFCRELSDNIVYHQLGEALTRDLLTTSQVAKRYACTERGVRANVARGALPAIQAGHLHLIPISEADKFYKKYEA